MSKTRLDFDSFIRGLKGDDKVYFQPPPSLQMRYPAIRYKLYTIDNQRADNSAYKLTNGYEVSYITKDPDDPFVKVLSEIPMCSFDRFYTSDNLNHFNFTIFY